MSITTHNLTVDFTANGDGTFTVDTIKDQDGREVSGGSNLLDLIEPALIEAAPFMALEEAWANCEHPDLFHIY